MDSSSNKVFALALCSMPWAIFNRPSVQLASLQSYLQQKTAYRVDSFHPYLGIAALIGTDVYPEIALSGWAGEALFSALLYPEKKKDTAKLFHSSISASTRKRINFNTLVDEIEQQCQCWLNAARLEQYDCIGFSICFNQLLPSLYMAKLVKKRHPNLPILFGGSSCSGEVGESLLKEYKQIDYIIDGEGEERLLTLCRFLDNKTATLVDGIICRTPPMLAKHPIEPLAINDLPFPDYSDYFKETQQTFPLHTFIPLLPVEFSRGCWWNKCTFCNLNVQWHNYRYKSSDRMIHEIMALSQKYESLHFTFTDNALPPREADQFFAEIAKKAVDFDFFAEIRGTSKVDRLKNYRSGGLTTIQVGIEALSTSLLKKMAKGNSTMDNIAMMKLCTEQGIKMEGNLILDFPTTSMAEINETIDNLAYVQPFAPLEAATFFLGYGSPIYKNLQDYSIRSIVPHAKTKMLFPKKCHNSMTMLISSYRGDKSIQQQRWKPVRKLIAAWLLFHKNRENKSRPALSYRDGQQFLIIRQEQAGKATLHHRLRGLSRKIYLAALIPTKLSSIQDLFPQVSINALEQFIDEMCSKRLMFQESGRILSLAVQQH